VPASVVRIPCRSLFCWTRPNGAPTLFSILQHYCKLCKSIYNNRSGENALVSAGGDPAEGPGTVHSTHLLPGGKGTSLQPQGWVFFSTVQCEAWQWQCAEQCAQWQDSGGTEGWRNGREGNVAVSRGLGVHRCHWTGQARRCKKACVVGSKERDVSVSAQRRVTRTGGGGALGDRCPGFKGESDKSS
jgi:hypothetical protein